METPADLREGWARRDGVRLHYLESGDRSLPHLFLPGTFGYAEDYLDEMRALAPRRCISVSLRGRGRSDVPERGYTYSDHVDDLDAAVEQIGLERFSLMAYSMAVPWALGYALRRPERIAGLILGDYPARYRALSPKWTASALEAMPERAHPIVAEALARESVEVLLWDELAAIRCPVRILRGGQPGAMVNDEVEARYRRALPQLDVVTIAANGRELWKPDFDGYIGAVSDFLSRLE